MLSATVKPFRSKNDTYSVRDELPGELFEGGSYFSMLMPRRGVNREGSFSRGVIQGYTVNQIMEQFRAD